MTSTPVGAFRAAVLLRSLLDQNGRALSTQTATDLIDDGAGLPDGDRSGERALRRAVDDLRSWGHQVEWATNLGGRTTVRLLPPDPAEVARRLQLSSGEDGLRRAARSLLQLMDPDQEVEPHVLLKAHVPRDRISFRYGQDGAEYEGVPYGIELSGRPSVLVATAAGDLGFHADAIRSLRIISRGDDISGHDPAPPFVGAEAVSRSWLAKGRGRPKDFAKLREAQVLITAIHSSAVADSSSPDSLRSVTLQHLADMTGVDEEQIRGLGDVIELLDKTIQVEEDVAALARHETDSGASLDGSQAMTAWLDLTALLALGDAASAIDARLTVTDMKQLAAKFDGFLDRVTMPEIHEALPCADAIVDAAIASAEGHVIPLPVLIDDNGTTKTCTLRVENLVRSRHRWWVTGANDDAPIHVGQLLLSSILQMDPET